MNKKHILFCCINLLCCFPLLGQITDSIQLENKKPGILIGVDIFRPVSQFVSDAAGYEVFTAIPIRKRWQIVGAVGYESNKFTENDWDVEVDGIFGRLGAQWFISQNTESINSGYYTGGQLAYSNYKQTINQYVINSSVWENMYGSVAKHSANAIWLEPLAGARVALFGSNFYADASVQLRILIHNKSTQDIDPLVIPGFGQDRNGLNIGLKWGIAYIF